MTSRALIGSRLWAAVLAAAISNSLRAQPATDADSAWQAIVAAQTAAHINTAPNPSDATQVAASVAEQNRLKALAAAAHDFYSNFSTDGRVGDARKLEALALLEAVELGDQSGSANAKAVASALRSDRTAPPRDRLDVALAQYAADRSQGATALGSEAEVDALHQEFGDIPEVFSLYLGLSRTTDSANAVRIAGKLRGMNVPPGFIKDQADQLFSRSSLIGTHVNAAAWGIGLQQKDVEKASGATVLYFWNGNSPTSDLGAFDSVKAQLPTGASLVFVELGSTTAANHPTLLAGATVADARTFDAPIAQALGVGQLPAVVVLTANGRISGFGQVSELPALIAAALK